jgi:hypothetical protein
VFVALTGSIVAGVPMNGQQLVSVGGRSLMAASSNNNVCPPTKADRVLLAEALKVNFLEQDRDIKIRARGRGGKILVVKSNLINEPFVLNFSDDGRLIKRLQVAGFMSIHFENRNRIWDQQVN